MRKKKLVISLLLLHFLICFNTISTRISGEKHEYLVVIGNFFCCLMLDLFSFCLQKMILMTRTLTLIMASLVGTQGTRLLPLHLHICYLKHGSLPLYFAQHVDLSQSFLADCHDFIVQSTALSPMYHSLTCFVFTFFH